MSTRHAATPLIRSEPEMVHALAQDDQVRISAIVDACFRLIVDGESAPSVTRWRSAQVLVFEYIRSSATSLKRAVVGP